VRLFARGRLSSTGAARIRHPRLGLDNLLYDDVVPPVVAEIVDVNDLRLRRSGYLPERCRGLVFACSEVSSSGVPNSPQTVSNECRWQ
jgi:hypothetical protein